MAKQKQIVALTQKQSKFCQEYMRTGNASEAYRIVYNCENMKPFSVNRKAKELMDNVKISARIAIIKERAEERAVVSAAYVLNRHKEIDEMDVADILNDDWTLKSLSAWPKVWRTYLSSFDVQEVRAGQENSGTAMAFIKKIKWPDKLRNLELLGKHVSVQAYKEKIAVENDGPPIINVIFMEPKR